MFNENKVIDDALANEDILLNFQMRHLYFQVMQRQLKNNSSPCLLNCGLVIGVFFSNESYNIMIKQYSYYLNVIGLRIRMWIDKH